MKKSISIVFGVITPLLVLTSCQETKPQSTNKNTQTSVNVVEVDTNHQQHSQSTKSIEVDTNHQQLSQSTKSVEVVKIGKKHPKNVPYPVLVSVGVVEIGGKHQKFGSSSKSVVDTSLYNSYSVTYKNGQTQTLGYGYRVNIFYFIDSTKVDHVDTLQHKVLWKQLY